MDLLSLTIIGIMATAAMTSFLWLVSGLTRRDVDMVRAIGALYTNSLASSLGPGLLMHFTGGLLAAYVYGVFLGLLSLEAPYWYAITGMLVGVVHGLLVTTVLKLLLAEHHPIHRYSAMDRQIFLLHVLAHVIYGLVIGTMFACFLL
jgi:hypothetical protein